MEYQTPRKLESAPASGVQLVSGDSFEVAEGLHLQFFSNKFIKTPLPAAATDPALVAARKQSRRDRMRTLTSSLDGVDLEQIRQEAKEREQTSVAAPAAPVPEDTTNSNNVIPPASTSNPAPMLTPSSKQKAKVSFNNDELEKVRTIPPRERRPSATSRKPSLSPRKSINRKASQSVDLTLFNELSSLLKSANEDTASEKKEEAVVVTTTTAATTTPRTLFQVGEESAESKRSSVDAKISEFMKSSLRRTFSLSPAAAATTAVPVPPPTAPTAADIFRMELIRAKSEVQATLKPAAATVIVQPISITSETSTAPDTVTSSPKSVPASAPESPQATTEFEITLSTQITSPPPPSTIINDLSPTPSNESATFINNARLQFLQPIKPSHSSSSSSVSSAGSSTLSMSPIGEGSNSDGSVVSTPTPIPTHDETATATPEASDIATTLPSFQALNIHSSLFEHRSKVHSALHRRSQQPQHGEVDETTTTIAQANTASAQISPPVQQQQAPSSALAAAIAASRTSQLPPAVSLPSFAHPPPRHASATIVPTRPSPSHQRNNSRSMSTDSVFATSSPVPNAAIDVTSASRTPASPVLSAASSTSPSMIPVPSSPLSPASHAAKIPSPLAGHRALKQQSMVTSPTNYRHSHSASLPTSPLFPQAPLPSAVSPVPPRDRTSPSMNPNIGSSIFHSPRTASSTVSFAAPSPTNNRHMKSFSLGAAPTPGSPQHSALPPPSGGTSLLPAISSLLNAASSSTAPSGATSSRAAAVNRMSSVGGRSESRRAVSDLTAALYILNRKR